MIFIQVLKWVGAPRLCQTSCCFLKPELEEEVKRLARIKIFNGIVMKIKIFVILLKMNFWRENLLRRSQYQKLIRVDLKQEKSLTTLFLQNFVLYFRVQELQTLLTYANCNRVGKKIDLQSRALDLLKTRLNDVKDKVREIYEAA